MLSKPQFVFLSSFSKFTDLQPYEPYQNLKLCPCVCSQDLNSTVFRKVTENVRKILHINVRQLSARVRRLTSAQDNRPASVTLGFVAWALLIVLLLLVLGADMITLLRFCLEKKDRTDTVTGGCRGRNKISPLRAEVDDHPDTVSCAGKNF